MADDDSDTPEEYEALDPPLGPLQWNETWAKQVEVFPKRDADGSNVIALPQEVLMTAACPGALRGCLGGGLRSIFLC